MNAVTPIRAYAAHPLHGPDRAYRETNCYTDVIIERGKIADDKMRVMRVAR